MKYTYGTIIAVVAALFFYLRLIILQRQKLKQAVSMANNPRKKNYLGAKQEDKKAANTLIPKMEIVSPYLLGLGIVLILLGAALSAATWFNMQARELWWIPVSAGIMLMSFSLH